MMSLGLRVGSILILVDVVGVKDSGSIDVL